VFPARGQLSDKLFIVENNDLPAFDGKRSVNPI